MPLASGRLVYSAWIYGINTAGESVPTCQNCESHTSAEAFDPFSSTAGGCSLILDLDDGMRTVAALFSYDDWRLLIAHPDFEEVMMITIRWAIDVVSGQ